MRAPGWETRFVETIEAHSSQPFVWGASDCWCFSMDVVQALTGADPWAHARRYRTRIGAARILKAEGFSSVADAVAATFAPVPVSMAWRGDLAIVDSEDGPVVAVVEGVQLVAKSEAGLIRLPRAMARQTFRVE